MSAEGRFNSAASAGADSALPEFREAETKARRFGHDLPGEAPTFRVGFGAGKSLRDGLWEKASKNFAELFGRIGKGAAGTALLACGEWLRAGLETLVSASWELFRAWARGRPAPLLMGLHFLLMEKDTFSVEHPLDRAWELGEGGSLRLDARDAPESGALLELREGRPRLRSARESDEIWVQRDGEFRRLGPAEEVLLETGTLFFVGARPEGAHRRGFDPRDTRAYRVEDPAGSGSWSVRELAHAEQRWEDLQVDALVRGLGLTEAEARETIGDFHRELAASGWSEAQRARFARLEFLGDTWMKTFRLLGFKRPPLYDSVAELLRHFRESHWEAEGSFVFLEGMVREGGLSPGGFEAEAVFHGLEALRKLGVTAPEMLSWSLAVARSGAEFEAALHYFPKNLKVLTESGLTRPEAAAWLLDILSGLGESARVVKPDNLLPFLRDAELNPEQVRSLLRTLIDVLGDAAHRDEQIRGAMEEIYGAQTGANLVETSEFSKIWGNPAVFSYFVQVTAAFAKGLNGFGIPAETRLELMTAMIEAYREEVDKTFMDLMMPEYEGFFAAWRVTLPELFEEMRQYTRKN
ncbi:MAG: hypothetical protein IT572_06445 [Deltaproteobacteria bacterium]|nr:hypothetical protein [Deltaproteobacteria bacterium]